MNNSDKNFNRLLNSIKTDTLSSKVQGNEYVAYSEGSEHTTLFFKSIVKEMYNGNKMLIVPPCRLKNIPFVFRLSDNKAYKLNKDTVVETDEFATAELVEMTRPESWIIKRFTDTCVSLEHTYDSSAA